ncbi:MAG: NAD-dependent epimerase/dehydratase family protein [Dehalococcoidia bacterium]|nr:NAD-dependent epimerase/dehydratase family protein [Dehalococcoidia bacterium]
MTKKTVLIAGASGLVGEAAARKFASQPDWDVIGVSRRIPPDLPGVQLQSVDLLDEAACKRAFGAMGHVTHLIYAAVNESPGLFAGWIDDDQIERNGRMLRNLFEPLSEVAAGLEHVSLLHGTKAYGLHHPSIPPERVPIPLKERAPRVEHPNFYWVQEDYLRAKQAGRSWGITTMRPTVIYGEAPGNNLNPLPALAAYAALLREAGEPLHFPGSEETRVIREAVDAELVADALLWAATSPAARGEAFNLTNGDVYVWEHTWPAIADALGMAVGEQRPVTLGAWLPAHQDAWAALVAKHRLAAAPDIVEFAGANSIIYADMLLGPGGRSNVPFLNSTIKARQAGFQACMDTGDMFGKLFRRLVERRMIPPAP